MSPCIEITVEDDEEGIPESSFDPLFYPYLDLVRVDVIKQAG